MNKAIEIKDVSKKYGSIEALDSVSLYVEPGTLYGLIGPDGAGKTSLYKILATLMAPDAGSAQILGLDVVKDFRRLRQIIGYMPEQFSLYQDMTVRENLNFYASIFGVSIQENYNIIAPVFSQLEKFPNRLAGKLSGGMKQKLALSCALIHKPEILLLDEPTTGVDAVSRSEFWDMLSSLKDFGITILVSTSYMDEATRCDRIAMIDRGRILDEDTPAKLVGRLDENLYEIAAKEMFLLLEELRRMPEVKRCYTFGAFLHVVGAPDLNPQEVKKKLESKGLHDILIRPTKGDIEDYFIKLSDAKSQ